MKEKELKEKLLSEDIDEILRRLVQSGFLEVKNENGVDKYRLKNQRRKLNEF